MSATYDDVSRHEPYTAPGERIPGPPSGGLIFLWIGWLLAAGFMLLIGGPVLVGILQAVA